MAVQRKILVVDDTEANLKLLRALLRGAGYEVVTASGGEEGVRAAAAERPDLILLDIMMPDLTGFEVPRRPARHRSCFSRRSTSWKTT